MQASSGRYFACQLRTMCDIWCLLDTSVAVQAVQACEEKGLEPATVEQVNLFHRLHPCILLVSTLLLLHLCVALRHHLLFPGEAGPTLPQGASSHEGKRGDLCTTRSRTLDPLRLQGQVSTCSVRVMDVCAQESSRLTLPPYPYPRCGFDLTSLSLKEMGI